MPVNGHDSAFDDNVRALSQIRNRVLIVQSDLFDIRFPAHRAIHRARVDVAVTKRSGKRARDGALPRAGWAINGDDESGHS